MYDSSLRYFKKVPQNPSNPHSTASERLIALHNPHWEGGCTWQKLTERSEIKKKPTTARATLAEETPRRFGHHGLGLFGILDFYRSGFDGLCDLRPDCNEIMRQKKRT
jgi:hypothetical protein